MEVDATITLNGVTVHLSTLPTSRQHAKLLGSKHYLRSEGCSTSLKHLGVLKTHNSECIECARDYAKKAALKQSPERKAEIYRRRNQLAKEKTKKKNIERGYSLKDTEARSFAKQSGLKTYSTGKPCPKGHIDPSK